MSCKIQLKLKRKLKFDGIQLILYILYRNVSIRKYISLDILFI